MAMSFIEKWTAQGENKRHALFLDMEREYRASAEADPANRAQWIAGAERMAQKADAAKSALR
jgi:hypothetical protein